VSKRVRQEIRDDALEDGLVDPRRELARDLDLHLVRPFSRRSGNDLLHPDDEASAWSVQLDDTRVFVIQ